MPNGDTVVTITSGDFLTSERVFSTLNSNHSFSVTMACCAVIALLQRYLPPTPGQRFIRNHPYLLSAIRMAEAGVATVEDIDTAVVAGLSHPMGPLRLSDLVGLDTLKLIADSMFEEFKEPQYGPPPLLQRMVEAGQLGKKSGKGFYDY